MLSIPLFHTASGQKSFEYKGWRMVKSETCRDAEILVRNPSPRLFGKKFRDSKKVNTNHAKTRLRDLIKNASEISRSCQNFPRPTFFEVPFATPNIERRHYGMSCNQYSSKLNQSVTSFKRQLRRLLLFFL